MQKYRKFIVAIVGAVIAGLYAYYGPASDNNQLLQTIIASATALGVYATPNAQQ